MKPPDFRSPGRVAAIAAATMMAGCLMAALASAADPMSRGPMAGVAVLGNGQVVEGRIHCEDDSYVIQRSRGGQIRLPRSQVETICGSMAEVYRFKAARIPQLSASEHLGLARWCALHQLDAAAQSEAETARSLDPLDPEVQQFCTSLARRRARPLADHAVKPAGFVATRPARPSRPAGSDDPLHVPPDTLHDFTLRVQPILIRSCAVAGCHDVRHPGPLRLDRGSSFPQMAARLTKQNLRATLETIDATDPGNSPLLRRPASPHAANGQPVFVGQFDTRYRLLAAWVDHVTGKTPPAPEPAALTPDQDVSAVSFPPVPQAALPGNPASAPPGVPPTVDLLGGFQARARMTAPAAGARRQATSPAHRPGQPGPAAVGGPSRPGGALTAGPLRPTAAGARKPPDQPATPTTGEPNPDAPAEDPSRPSKLKISPSALEKFLEKRNNP